MAEQEEHVDVELGRQPLRPQLGMDRLHHQAAINPVVGCVPTRLSGHCGRQPGDRIDSALVDPVRVSGAEEAAGQTRPAVFVGALEDPGPEPAVGGGLVAGL
jgi:hypothetical protein